MKAILKFFIQKKYFTNILTIAVISGGIISAMTINYEVFPNVNINNVMVNTIYPGSSADEVERAVTNIIEPELEGIQGVEKISSQSGQGRSFIVLDIMEGYDLNRVEEDVRNAINQIQNLPKLAERPIVTSPSMNEVPLVELGISGLKNHLQLRDVVHGFRRELQFLPGVSAVETIGMQNKEVWIELNVDQMKSSWLSLNEVLNALRTSSLSIPAGEFLRKDKQKSGEVIVESQLHDLRSIRDLPIRANELGQTIGLNKIAEVSYQLEEANISYIINENPGIGISVAKQTDADVFAVITAIESKVKELKERYPGLEVAMVNNTAKYVKMRLSALSMNFLLGLFLIFILLPFIIEFKFVVIIALGQIFAFAGALILLNMMGTSLNIISLVGLIIMVGIVFDDSIVVNENIATFSEKGADMEKAALEGAYSILKPISAAVFTTMVAFLPLAFMSNLFGRFIREIPIAVVSVLSVSYLEAFLILPSHGAHWFQGANRNKFPGRIARKMKSIRQGWPQTIIQFYVKSLSKVLRHYLVSSLGFLFLFALTVFIFLRFMQLNLFPSEAVLNFYVETVAHEGTSLAAHRESLLNISRQIVNKNLSAIENIRATAGSQQREDLEFLADRGPEFGLIQVFLVNWQDRTVTAQELIDELKKEIIIPTNLKRVNWVLGRAGPPTGDPIDVSIMGEKYEDIRIVVQRLKDHLNKLATVIGVEDSYQASSKYFSFELVSELSRAAGISYEELGTTLQAAFWGVKAAEIRELDEVVDVRVRFQDIKENFNEWKNLETMNKQGNFIRLDQMASVKRVNRPIKHEHLQGQRRVRVRGQIDQTRVSVSEINQYIRSFLDRELKSYPELGYQIGGEGEKTEVSLHSLFIAALVAIAFIFIILIVTFDGILKPLLILLILPSCVVAVILAFFVHNQPISFLALLGVIALLGVSANDTIVFLYHFEKSTKGTDILKRILDTAEARARPIFMTSITTVLGVLPTAYGIAGADPFIEPIALAIGWGVFLGSLIIFFLFPLSLYILELMRQRLTQ
jgi:multidrug efflux pump subunit AcrB